MYLRAVVLWAAALACGWAFAQPVVTSVAVPANKTYGPGELLAFSVQFDVPVAVDASGGLPALGVIVGSDSRPAAYAGGSGTSSIAFRYTVESGDIDLNGVAVGAIALNGGSIRDAATGTTNAVLTLNGVGSTAGVLVHAVPQVTAPASLALGSLAVGQAGAPQAIQVGNTGTVNLVVSFVGMTGTDAGQFAVFSSTCSTVTPGGSCTVNVRYQPSSVGSHGAGLVIVSNDPFQPTRTVALSGTGVAADTIPDFITFTPLTGVPRNTLQTSNAAAVFGINAPSPISVSGGEYSIGCNGTFTSLAGTISSGQTVCVRHISASQYRSTNTTNLTIGGSTFSFQTITEGFYYQAYSNGSGFGTISRDGVVCGGFCDGTVAPGAVVVLTATPSSDSLYGGWTGCDSVNGNTCTFTANANRVVNPIFQRIATFNVVLEGWQEVPYVATTAGGGGTVTYNPITKQLTLDLTYQGLSSAETGAAIHGGAWRESTAAALITLGAGSPKKDVLTLTPQQESLLYQGQLYVNIRTSGYPNGELRGQLDTQGARTTRTLTVARGGNGSGTVTGTNESGTVVNCGSDCSETVPIYRTIALTASPSAGSTFAGWSGACTGTATCILTLDSHLGVMATFNVVPVSDPPRLSNISTRGRVLTGDDVMIGGFIIGGSANKTVVVRARGPSLAAQGVAGVLANPQLQLFSGATQIGSNDNWQSAGNAAQLQSSGFAPADPNEAAMLVTLAPGAYSAIVSGVAAGTGVAIIEVFEVDAPELPLLNISTRMQVQTGDNVLIGGFIIQGNAAQTVVVRARGPSLAAQGVPGVLANPRLQLFSGTTEIAANDNWQAAANAAQIQSSGFAPSDANESAILVTLQPGAYSAIVSGVGGTTGVAIIEVFRVAP